MKRSISVTSINSTDSVIPIEVIEVPPTAKINIIQTRSKPNNSFNSNLNNSLSNNQKKAEPLVRRSVSPFSLVYIDSETASTSDTVNNKINDVSRQLDGLEIELFFFFKLIFALLGRYF